jgi:hypothetical protein
MVSWRYTAAGYRRIGTRFSVSGCGVRILFDQGTPVPLRRHLHPHAVDTAAELGWSELANGDLLAAAESAGYQLMITTDQNLRYQQNLSERNIAIMVLRTTSWPRIQAAISDVIDALKDVDAGAYAEVEIPRT